MSELRKISFVGRKVEVEVVEVEVVEIVVGLTGWTGWSGVVIVVTILLYRKGYKGIVKRCDNEKNCCYNDRETL